MLTLQNVPNSQYRLSYPPPTDGKTGAPFILTTQTISQNTLVLADSVQIDAQARITVVPGVTLFVVALQKLVMGAGSVVIAQGAQGPNGPNGEDDYWGVP